MDFLAQRTRRSPHHPALIWRGQRWTYAQLNASVAAMADRLFEQGIQPGDHVAALVPNRPETIFLIHALARLGAVLVPLNTRLTPHEIRWHVGQSGCRVLVCARDTEEKALLLKDTLQVLRAENLTNPGLRSASAAQTPPRGGLPKPEALQSIVFTSGTTGYAKGAMLTFSNHTWSAAASAYRLGHMPGDRWLLAMPLYHVGGMAIVFRCCLYGTTVVLQDKFDPERVNRALDREGVTIVSLVPTMLGRLHETRRGGAPSNLRCVLVGGAAAPPELLQESLARGFPIGLTYGLTEAASQVATSTPAESARKPGSVGKPLLFTDLRIANINQSANSDGHLAPNEIGEIILRGPTVMRGYYRHGESSYPIGQNGWLHTGDLGYLDEQGDLWIVQRRVDLILSGGENVYPSEVERVLRSHPNVHDACVVGLQDPEWGQRVGAAILWEGSGTGELSREAALQTFLRARLAGYKVPRVMRFVDTLPQTASGKVKRKEVQKLFEVEQKA